MPRETRVQSLMREMLHYDNSASVSFFKLPTSQLAEEDNSDPKLHIAITSDRVVTKTSNLDTDGKKTLGIY